MYAQDLIENFVRPEPEVDPGWFVESRETRNARLEWFREAKFGMFVHWGVYSYLEGSYQGRAGY